MHLSNTIKICGRNCKQTEVWDCPETSLATSSYSVLIAAHLQFLHDKFGNLECFLERVGCHQGCMDLIMPLLYTNLKFDPAICRDVWI